MTDAEFDTAVALDLGQHTFGILVKTNRDLAIKLRLEILYDSRIDIFAPDKEVEFLFSVRGANQNQSGDERKNFLQHHEIQRTQRLAVEQDLVIVRSGEQHFGFRVELLGIE